MSTPEDATRLLQALAPIINSPANPLNMGALADKILRDFGVSDDDRKRIVG